jgi:Malic enzyme, N-terminal domain
VERQEFGLTGLLPPGVSSVAVQLDRIYGNYRQKTSNLERYIHLVSLQDRNETAFYRLLSDHLVEMMPIVYTPVIGEACQAYSRIYRRPRRLYISGHSATASMKCSRTWERRTSPSSSSRTASASSSGPGFGSVDIWRTPPSGRLWSGGW